MPIPWWRIEKTKTCWLWVGIDKSSGYGRYQINKKVWRAHRYIYTALVGNIPRGLQLDHLCRNRRCVNPEHLEAVTQKINILRGVGASAKNARKVDCPKGHSFNEQNTIYYKMKSGSIMRRCLQCKRRRNQEYKLRVRLRQKPPDTMAGNR